MKNKLTLMAVSITVCHVWREAASPTAGTSQTARVGEVASEEASDMNLSLSILPPGREREIWESFPADQ